MQKLIFPSRIAARISLTETSPCVKPRSSARLWRMPKTTGVREIGRGVFYQMLLIPHGKPDAAGRPYSVILRRSALQFPHNVDGPLIVHLNTDIQIVPRTGRESPPVPDFPNRKRIRMVSSPLPAVKSASPISFPPAVSISTCGPASSTSERSRQKAEAKHCRQPSHPFHPTLLLLLLLRLLPLLPLYCNTFLLLSINPL